MEAPGQFSSVKAVRHYFSYRRRELTCQLAELDVTEKQIIDQMMARYTSVIDDLKSMSNDSEEESGPDEFLSCENDDEKTDFADIGQKFNFDVENPENDTDSLEFASLTAFD